MGCHVCENDSAQFSQQSFNILYNCNQCGNFLLPMADIPRLIDELRPVVSAYIRENQSSNKHPHLTQELINSIQRIPLPTINEKIAKLMRWMERKTSYIGESIDEIGKYPELVAICYAKNMREVKYLLDYLKKRELIESDSSNTRNKITIDGFKYLESEKKKINSNLCFCAMSFSHDHEYIYKQFIEPAVTMAGYSIKRVDQDPHNEGIFDKVIALIRQSKFVVADLTGDKQGVYYEAGWAKRGEQEVFFTCEETDFHKIHFDVRHLNVLKWKKDNIPEAIEKLKWWIEGKIGAGDFQQNK